MFYLTFQTPLFGNIFDELYLPDDLWHDVDKIPLLNETTAKEPEKNCHDEKPKITNNMVIAIYNVPNKYMVFQNLKAYFICNYNYISIEPT